ncbi:MAG: hypothetical protein SFW08_06025 [Gemmatimonadaceae bacterium]|nr:hypothetical protein [Gemmatimonadaceae bacterium]
MPHPDEGLIHAWLDGALPADEAARVEALVRDDPAWGAAAAEARGLIANASRVLASLDDVPRAVPQPVTSVTPMTPVRPLAAPRARRWVWQVSSIAAVLLVAVVARETWRQEPPPAAVTSAPAAIAAAPVTPPAVPPAAAPAQAARTPTVVPPAVPITAQLPTSPTAAAPTVDAVSTAPMVRDVAAAATREVAVARESRTMAAKSADASAGLNAAAPAPVVARRASGGFDLALATQLDVRCVVVSVRWNGRPEPETFVVVPWQPASRVPDFALEFEEDEGRRVQLTLPSGSSVDHVVRRNARGEVIDTGRVAEMTRCRQ